MKSLVEFLVKSLVARPDAVSVVEKSAVAGQVFEVSVAPEDLGRVIGKQGRTIKAIRSVVTAAASKVRTKASVLVAE